jgi:hypothetical protein
LILRLRPLSHPVLLLSVLFASLFGLSPAANAQSAVSGAIGGTIYDQQKAVVPGAIVTATDTATKAVVTVTSNAEGLYRFGALAPSIYTITVTRDGFKTFKEGSVTVTVGILTDVSPELTLGAAIETVEVTDEAPVMHTQSYEISTVIDQNLIDDLPINGRRASNFALLTPGVVANDQGFGLLSFRGTSYLLNNSTVDGADDNQAYFSEARGRTRAQYAVTQGAIQEFQVNTLNYSAEYGRSAGGVINTVTKSGSNQLHGELYFYDRDNDWGAANPYTLVSVPTPGTNAYTTMPIKPKDWRKQWGFGIGGPILRDRLFWFYAYDQSRRNFPGLGRASDPQDTFATANATLPAGETCTSGNLTAGGSTYTSTTFPVGTVYAGDAAACATAYDLYLGNGAAAFQQGSAYYSQGLGVLQSFLGTVPRSQDQVINFPKLDYQISARNHLALQYNRLRLSSPAGIQTQTSVFYGTHSFGNDFVKTDFGIARLNTVITPSLNNQLLFQYGRDFEYESSQPPAGNEIPLANGLNNGFGRPPDVEIGYSFDANGFDIGKPITLERRALPSERRLQGMDSITWTHGRHVAKAGLDFNRVFDYVDNLYNENGDYSEDYSSDFISDYLHAVSGLGTPAYQQKYYSFSQGFGNSVGEIATTEYAGFLTDDWRINPNLTLTLGVRYEYEYVPANGYANTGNPAVLLPAVPQTANHPDDRNNVGPRVGFAWNIHGDNKTVLRGGYGLYYGRIINSNILQTYLESGGTNAQINVSGVYQSLYKTCAPIFPNILASAASFATCVKALPGTNALPVFNIAYLDPHLQNPAVHEVDLSFEQDLGWNTSFSLSYLASFGRELDSSIDTNTTTATDTLTYTVNDAVTAPAAGGYITYPHGGKAAPLPTGFQYTTKVFTATGTGKRPMPAYGTILDIASNVNSKYNALAAQVNHRLNHGFSILSSYTWSHALDFNPYIGTGVPTFNVFDPTNLRKEYGNSSLDVRNRFVLAAVYAPNYNLHGWENQAFGGWRLAPVVQAQTGLGYTPTVSGSGSSPTVTLAYKGLNGSGSSANRIDILGRNQFHRPNEYKVDLRLSKNFEMTDRFGRFRLELLAEAFNLTNHQNITGVTTSAYSVSGTVLSFTPNFGTNTNSNSNATWEDRQIEIAARLHF